MNILAPVNSPQEVQKIIQAGADEIFCGVLPNNWKEKHTNMASPNRREWATANLKNYGELQEVVNIAHAINKPVFLTLNALYTQKQYPLVCEQIEEAKKTGIDALIVADLGLLITLKKLNTGLDIHISTGGTVFNSQTAKFYEDLGASRIVLPRHLQVKEIEQIVKDCPTLKFEVFILNSGCKNIDGFCTFQHGINEILHGKLWDFPKKLNFDRHLLNAIRRLPKGLSRNIKSGIFGIDSACLLNYQVDLYSSPINLNKKREREIINNVSSCFNMLSGVDTCGACRLAEFLKMGICAVKVVGRNYSTAKKVKDVIFLSKVLFYLEEKHPLEKELTIFVKKTFKQIYSINCGNLCYYPDPDKI
jgi:U32 family peptidase